MLASLQPYVCIPGCNRMYASQDVCIPGTVMLASLQPYVCIPGCNRRYAPQAVCIPGTVMLASCYTAEDAPRVQVSSARNLVSQSKVRPGGT